MKNNLDDRYVRTDDFASRAESLEFPPQVWAVFAQIEQPRSVKEVAAALNIAPDVVDGAFSRLLEGKVIRQQVVGWNAFSAASPSAGAPAGSSLALPKSGAKGGAAAVKSGAVVGKQAAGPGAKASVAAGPAKSAASAPVAKAPPSPTVFDSTLPAGEKATIYLRLASQRSLASVVEPTVSLRVSRPVVAAAPTAAPTADSSTSWKLRPILDAIAKTKGGGVPGQLLVYKVFLQLPPDLLKAAGLTSISAVDDNFTVTHPALRAAIVEAARVHANIDINALMAA